MAAIPHAESGPTTNRRERAIVRESAEQPPSATLVLLHGRGADAEVFSATSKPLWSRDFRIISLDAPFPNPTGGRMWYEFTEKGVDHVSMSASLSAIDEITEALCGHESNEVPSYLVGFSQGASISLAFATLRPKRLRGVVAFSGFLMEGSLLPGPLSALKGMRIFMAHGRADRAIPFSWAESARARLESAGALVKFVAHPEAHTVPAGVWDEARAWILDDLVASKGTPHRDRSKREGGSMIP